MGLGRQAPSPGRGLRVSRMTRPTSPRAIFVDSSGFFAAAVPTDDHHDSARRALQRAARESRELVTTSWVVAESHALFLARAGRDAGVRFLRGVHASAIGIVRPTPEDEAEALQVVFR